MLCCMYIMQHCGEGCWVGAELGRLLDAGASSPSRYGGTLTLRTTGTHIAPCRKEMVWGETAAW